MLSLQMLLNALSQPFSVSKIHFYTLQWAILGFPLLTISVCFNYVLMEQFFKERDFIAGLPIANLILIYLVHSAVSVMTEPRQ